MDLVEIPAGFSMALAQNEKAVNAYSMMTKEQKNDVLLKARSAQSQQEMRQLVSSIAADAIM